MKKFNILLIKFLKRVNSYIKLIIWKLLYLNSFYVGKGTIFYPNCRIILDKNGKVIIGNNCFFNHNCSITSLEKVTIGNDCIFGENVKIYDHNHNYKDENVLIRKQDYNSKKVIIGNNCWIGSNVVILKGVTIGNNCVIGAGTIVYKNIEDNSIVVSDGNIKIKKIKGE